MEAMSKQDEEQEEEVDGQRCRETFGVNQIKLGRSYRLVSVQPKYIKLESKHNIPSGGTHLGYHEGRATCTTVCNCVPYTCMHSKLHASSG